MTQSTLTPNRSHLLAEEACECDNCAWSGELEEVKPIQHPGQRLDPGSTVPAGECPDCGALAYLSSSMGAHGHDG